MLSAVFVFIITMLVPRRANAVCPYMGSGFYPLVLATKKYVM